MSEENKQLTVRQILDRLLESQDMSLAQLADKLQVAESTIYNWYAGVKKPSRVNRLRLERYFRNVADEQEKKEGKNIVVFAFVLFPGAICLRIFR